MPTGVYKRKPFTEEHKRKMRKPKSEEHRKNISKGRKGMIFSEDTKRKLSEAHKGKKLSEETRRKMSIAKSNMSEETKKKLRLARLKQKLPTIDTSIERKFEAYLKEKKINYIHPFNLGNKFQCDFYLPFLNLIVECDGTYWHSREDMKRRDKSKDAYAKKCGFNMLRLREEEINKGRFFLI